jgi:hypothetical protein
MIVRDRRYYVIICVITAVILAVGGLLWSSGKVDLVDEKTEFTVSPWYLGPEEAPVTIDMYTDFG